MKVQLTLSGDDVRRVIRDAMIAKLGSSTVKINYHDVNLNLVKRRRSWQWPIESATVDVVTQN